MLRKRRITLYLLSELGLATLVGISVWTVILMMNDLFFIARQAIQKDLGLDLVLQILALRIPNLLILAIPIGTLLGSLIAIGRLSADGEIVALQAIGLGPRQLLGPMAIHGTLAFVAAISIYAFIQPWASYEGRLMQGKILNARNVSTELRPRVFFDKVPGYVMFVDEIPPGTQGVLQRVLFYEAADPKGSLAEKLILSKDAAIGPSAAREGEIRLVFKDGVQHTVKIDDPDSYQVSQFQVLSPLPLELPAWMRPTDEVPGKTVADMTPTELLQETRDARNEPDKTLRTYRMRWAATEIHRRFALPLASLLFALLSLPLGVSRVRSGKGAGFALSLGIVLIYYLLFTVGLEQSKDGRLPAWIGMWAGNFVIAVWVVIAFARMSRPSRPPFWAGVVERLKRLVPHRKARPDPAPPSPSLLEAAAADFGPIPRRRLSGLLDRYVGSLYLRTLGLALAATYLIFTLLELKSLIDATLERKQPAILILVYLKYFIPGVLIFALPFAAMIAAVVSVTVLGRTGEITAMKAAGISARRICLPIVILTLFCCVGLHLVQDRIAPETNRRAQAVKDQIQGRNPRTYGWTPGGRWMFGSGGRLYHYRLFDPANLRFQGLSVYRLDLARARVFEQWFCASAQWNGASWDVTKGWYRSFPEPAVVGEYRRFEEDKITSFDGPETFARKEQTLVASDLPEQTSIADLRQEIEMLAKGGYDTTRLKVDLWQKTSSVVTPLVTVILGLPFAFKVGRRGSMYGVGVGLILAIVFWAVAAISNALGLETILAPFLSAWAPDVLFAVIGIYLLLFIPT
ncbi:MAG TPA: LptF/LptG family permease [Candidatus Polarisedimenticolaceae bacterium]|nr:LptF/LptG family permease [Candidatus Polarisedimenticolaceae bacterium]